LGLVLGLGVSDSGQRFRRRRARFVQRAQDSLDLDVAFGDLGLVEIVELQGVAKGEDVLRAVISREGGADSRLGGSTPDITKLRESFRRMVATNDGANDAHPGGARDVR